MRRLPLFLSIFSFVISGAASSAAELPLKLDLETTGKTIALSVQSRTSMPIQIIRTGELAGKKTVNLNLVSSTNSPRFTISVGKFGPDSKLSNVPFTEQVLTVDLHVPNVPVGAKYQLRLMVIEADAAATQQNEPKTWLLDVTSAMAPRTAVLSVQPQGAITRNYVRPFCIIGNWCMGGEDDPVVTVDVSNTAGPWPLDGLTMRLDTGLKNPGSGFNRGINWDAVFTSNDSAAQTGKTVKPKVTENTIKSDKPKQTDTGTKAAPSDKTDAATKTKMIDIFAVPEPGQRLVKSGTTKLSFHNLEPGTYTVPLRFSAFNAVEDAKQVLTITLQVRNSVIPAILVLIAAAFISFVATRFVTTLRARASFLKRLEALRPAWLASEPAIPPVIWLRANLRLATDLSARFWLTGQSDIDAKLTEAEKMLNLLGSVHQVREKIRTIASNSVHQRAIWALDRIVDKIPAGLPNEQSIKLIEADLDKFGSWFDPQKQDAEYWADLLPRMAALASEVAANLPPDPNMKPLEQQLLKKVEAAVKTMPADLPHKIAAEQDYARLYILWDSRNDSALYKMVSNLDANDPVESFYNAVDDNAWESLKALQANERVVIEPNVEAKEYMPLQFEFSTPGNRNLNETFLVRQKLNYVWTITIEVKKSVSPNAHYMTYRTLTVRSDHPKIVQFSPKAGRIRASVKIAKRDGESLEGETKSGHVDVARSSAFAIWHIVELADLLSFAVALLVSVVSGLAINALSPTFGGWKEYLTLFTWGASLDQSKNFIQTLATYKKQTV